MLIYNGLRHFSQGTRIVDLVRVGDRDARLKTPAKSDNGMPELTSEFVFDAKEAQQYFSRINNAVLAEEAKTIAQGFRMPPTRSARRMVVIYRRPSKKIKTRSLAITQPLGTSHLMQH